MSNKTLIAVTNFSGCYPALSFETASNQEEYASLLQSWGLGNEDIDKTWSDLTSEDAYVLQRIMNDIASGREEETLGKRANRRLAKVRKIRSQYYDCEFLVRMIENNA